MKATLLVLILVGAGVYWYTRPPGELADISESKAKEIADEAMIDFCAGEASECGVYGYKGTAAPTDARFTWAFVWVSQFIDPPRKWTVMVGKKGDHSLESQVLSPDQILAGEASLPPGAATQGQAPAAPGEGAPPGEGASPAGEPAGEAAK